ncbi:HAD family hydrolase [Paenibacillus sp. y28]|uniref:HAD family hydrolase n=1 Tax=Paenibacillus sp. y28 TaxID=3129110 RepID=UPI003018AE36
MTQRFTKPEAMIFDMDGTLFQTESLLLPAYHATFDNLREEGLFEGPTPSEDLILGSLGMLLADIWRRVMPEASSEAHRRADELLLEFQLEGLKQGSGKLYAGVTETLAALRQGGVRLFIASNGLEAYVKQVAQYTNIARFFEGIYSAGEYRTRTKVELVDLLLRRHHLQSAWMVGDRSSDVEAGKQNGLFVVGCRYAGFGAEVELDGSDRFIDEFPALLEGLALHR